MTSYEIVHDKVRIKAGDTRQWLVYVDGVLRAQATSRQSAKDYVAIAKAKEREKSRGFVCCGNDHECMTPCQMRSTELYGH